jgi:hypothetical protein
VEGIYENDEKSHLTCNESFGADLTNYSFHKPMRWSEGRYNKISLARVIHAKRGNSLRHKNRNQVLQIKLQVRCKVQNCHDKNRVPEKSLQSLLGLQAMIIR